MNCLARGAPGLVSVQNGDALLSAAHFGGHVLHHAQEFLILLVADGATSTAPTESHALVQHIAQRLSHACEVYARSTRPCCGTCTV